MTEVYDDRFDWSDSETVLIERTAAVAIYYNTCGHVVIREQGDCYELTDTFIALAPANARRVAYRILALLEAPPPAGIPSERQPVPAAGPALSGGKPADRLGPAEPPLPLG